MFYAALAVVLRGVGGQRRRGRNAAASQLRHTPPALPAQQHKQARPSSYMARLTTPLVVAAAAAATAVVLAAVHAGHRARPGRVETLPDVRVVRSPLGRILVDARGYTLYLFLKDHGGMSACSAACARVWPPAVVSRVPRAGQGVIASRLTTITRRDHRLQLDYGGHPLYTMSADVHPGQLQGQGFLGEWFVVSPAGHRIGHAAAPAGGY